MQIDWTRVLPVIISVAIILVVAIARTYSRALAALFAVMPLSIPLALYVVYSAQPDDRDGLVDFTGGLLIGIIPLIAFLVVAHFAARAGWSLWQILGASYLVWALGYGLVLLIRQAITR